MLDLHKTNIGAPGILELTEGLKGNLIIAKLILSECNLSSIRQEAYSALVKLCEQNITITAIDISGNAIVDNQPLRSAGMQTTKVNYLNPYGHNLEGNTPLIVEKSSLVWFEGLGRSGLSIKAIDLIDQKREKLFEQLKRLENENDTEFSLKELLVIFKQIQPSNLEDIEPELSRFDIKPKEFYIDRIVKIFNHNFYSQGQAKEDSGSSDNIDDKAASSIFGDEQPYFDVLEQSFAMLLGEI